MNLQLVGSEPYNDPIESLYKDLNTDPDKGLSSPQIDIYLKDHGLNELPEVKGDLWRIYLAPIFNFLILILIISGIAVILLGSPQEAIITFVVVFINSITAIIQQYRARKAIKSLKKISSLTSTVIREGSEQEIPSKYLVPGDILLLNQGDKVPADARLIMGIDLEVNEAPLTGESVPVKKEEIALEETNLSIQKQKNMLFFGTYVVKGNAKALIVRTGEYTEIGTISSSLEKIGSIEEIPLTKKLNRLASILGVLILINLTVLIIFKLFILQLPVQNALVDSIIRALNIMPINLPLLVTLVLVTGVLNMAQSGVIIKNLSAIESLGRISVVCSDKTGTITKNEMTVKKFQINNSEFDVTGSGYDDDGEILKNGRNYTFHSETFSTLVDSIVVNNTAKLIFEDVKIKTHEAKVKAVRKVIGSPTEGALLVLAEKAGFEPYDIRQKYEKLKEFSFDSSLKRMTTVCKLKNGNGEVYAFSKGAPELILELSDALEIENTIKPLTDSLKGKINDSIQKQANQGYRTLGIAYRTLQSSETFKREAIENDLIFLGFVSIIDPPRGEVKEAIKECQAGGIKVVMITGDHPATAKTIATQMNIFKEGDFIIKGNEIKNLKNSEIDNISVYARVEPSDKDIIVKKYQEKDKVVAMTGDGVNDSLALKNANCGVAMGITGTDLAKETSDMVISDDNFASIKKGIETGRGLFSKIRTIIFFFICLNIMEGFIFLGLEFIPTVQLFDSNFQQIYIYVIAHSFPPLALVIDRLPKDIMQEPPRNEEEILNRNMWKMLLLQAFLMGLGLILILSFTLTSIIPLNSWNLNSQLSYIEPYASSTNLLRTQKARTMFISTLYIFETTFFWTFRRPNKSLLKGFFGEFSFTLFIASLFTISIHILVVSFSFIVNHTINDVIGLNFQLNFMFLSISDWLICLAFAIIPIIGIEIFKLYARKNDIYF
ncbi:MAG: cation-translocating P-type ATPase [Promethearchaeota archaeon]|nr:MAG: cation-translocating P-type ATPase [Candidatus Lokiarchaeota archaeon]